MIPELPPFAEDAMTNVVAAFVVAVGGTSLIYYLVLKWEKIAKLGARAQAAMI